MTESLFGDKETGAAVAKWAWEIFSDSFSNKKPMRQCDHMELKILLRSAAVIATNHEGLLRDRDEVVLEKLTGLRQRTGAHRSARLLNVHIEEPLGVKVPSLMSEALDYKDCGFTTKEVFDQKKRYEGCADHTSDISNDIIPIWLAHAKGGIPSGHSLEEFLEDFVKKCVESLTSKPGQYSYPPCLLLSVIDLFLGKGAAATEQQLQESPEDAEGVPEEANELEVLAAVAEASQKTKEPSKSKKKVKSKTPLFKGGLAFFLLGSIPKAFDVWVDPNPSKKKKRRTATTESPENATEPPPSPDSPVVVNLADLNPVPGPPSATKSKAAQAIAEAQKNLTEMRTMLGGLTSVITAEKKLQAIREKIKDLSDDIKELDDEDDAEELTRLKAELKKAKQRKRAMLTEIEDE